MYGINVHPFSNCFSVLSAVVGPNAGYTLNRSHLNARPTHKDLHLEMSTFLSPKDYMERTICHMEKNVQTLPRKSSGPQGIQT